MDKAQAFDMGVSDGFQGGVARGYPDSPGNPDTEEIAQAYREGFERGRSLKVDSAMTNWDSARSNMQGYLDSSVVENFINLV
jgi:hypothetical protein